jgi:hypothetical protein
MTRPRLACAAAVAALGMAGCASASLTQLWRDPNYRSPPVSRVVVLSAIPKDANPARFENAVAAALTAQGFQATTASSIFPPGRFDKVKMREYVEANKVDLLVMVRLTTEKAAPVVVTTTAAAGGWYGGVAGSQSTVVSQSTDVSARIEVFDLHTDPDTLIWSGQSNTVDIQGAAEALAADLVKKLRAEKILVK